MSKTQHEAWPIRTNTDRECIPSFRAMLFFCWVKGGFVTGCGPCQTMVARRDNVTNVMCKTCWRSESVNEAPKICSAHKVFWQSVYQQSLNALGSRIFGGLISVVVLMCGPATYLRSPVIFMDKNCALTDFQ